MPSRPTKGFKSREVLVAVGPGSTIKGIPEDVRNYINIVGNSANVKFDTLSRKKIPAEIYDNEELTPKTEVLAMPHNMIKKVPGGIGHLTKLRKLDLKGNDIAKIPRTVGKLKELNELDISRNAIKAVPPTIAKATKLEKMILRNNHLRKLPPKIGQVGRQLELLDVSNNALKKLPKSVYTLRGTVDCTNNRIESLPNVTSTKKTKPTVECLILRNNAIVELPESFEKLSYLLHLDLTANQISQLPLTIINLPYLSELLLADNAIWDLPEDFGRLRYSLKRLCVAGNKIEKLPDSIGTLVLCEEMDFSRNQIFELPVTMKGCVRLSRLNVSQNIIEYCDVLSDMKMLEFVDISSNRIGNFPDMIQDELTNLNLSRNRLTSLPLSVGDMIRLKKLNLSHNQLEEFPPMLGHGQLLSNLDVSFNMIEGDIQFDFQNIRMLDELNLSNNRITSLNSTIGKMEYLRMLDVSVNQLTTLFPLSKTLLTFNGSNNPWRLTHPQNQTQSNTFILPIIQSLEQLASLNMANVGLEAIDEHLAALLDLKYINFRENSLEEIPDSVLNKWRYVRFLDLSHNKINSLPKQIRSMQHLGELDLSFNLFEEFDPNFLQLRGLRKFRFSNNSLSKTPDNFGDMVSLRTLDLSNNQLTEFPSKNIDVLSSLKELDVSDNQIEQFPEQFEFLHLENVNMANNNIIELPSTIRNMKTIQRLNLSNNKLELIPDVIEKMSSLRHLDVQGNYLRFFPKCFASGMSNVEIFKDGQRSKRTGTVREEMPTEDTVAAE